ERGVAEAGRDRRRRAGRRAARHAPGGPDIDWRAVKGVLAQDAERDLVGDGLADQRGAGVEQGLHGPGMTLWNWPAGRPVVVAAAGRNAGYVEQILGREGQAGERPARPAVDPHARAGDEGADLLRHAAPLLRRMSRSLVALAAQEAQITEPHAEQLVEPDVD